MRYVLPGMGATSAMYGGVWRTLADTTFVDWPALAGAFSFADVARVLAEQYQVDSDDSLIGTSLGGMIALEIAGIANSRHVTLISSAKDAVEINQLLLALTPLARFAPIKLVQAVSNISSGELGRMFAEMDAEFIRGVIKALGHWRGGDWPDIEITRIHGSDDRVIPCPAEVDLVIDGGHLIAMTHADECVDIIEQAVRR